MMQKVSNMTYKMMHNDDKLNFFFVSLFVVVILSFFDVVLFAFSIS